MRSVARVGHLDLRTEAEFASSLRTDTPKQFGLLWTGAPSLDSGEGPLRHAQGARGAPPPHADVRRARTARGHGCPDDAPRTPAVPLGVFGPSARTANNRFHLFLPQLTARQRPGGAAHARRRHRPDARAPRTAGRPPGMLRGPQRSEKWRRTDPHALAPPGLVGLGSGRAGRAAEPSAAVSVGHADALRRV